MQSAAPEFNGRSGASDRDIADLAWQDADSVVLSRKVRWAREREKTLVRERALWESGVARVGGVDEVGVGPLAGPVVAAAVVLPPSIAIDGVRDSKKVSAARREVLAVAIVAEAMDHAIGVVSPAEVDRLNPYHGALEAMRRAVLGLAEPPEHLLVDARTVPGTPIAQTAIVRGDATVYSIAAASIVAKVHRDQIMAELDAVHPGYGFARNAGYGTAEHMRALESLGPCPAHRRTFAPVRRALESRTGSDKMEADAGGYSGEMT